MNSLDNYMYKVQTFDSFITYVYFFFVLFSVISEGLTVTKAVIFVSTFFVILTVALASVFFVVLPIFLAAFLFAWAAVVLVFSMFSSGRMGHFSLPSRSLRRDLNSHVNHIEVKIIVVPNYLSI